MMKPIIKWAGGKARISKYILSEFSGEYDTYYEPFLGGGYIFGQLLGSNHFRNAVISDNNVELINMYIVVRDFPYDLMVELKNDKYEYSKLAYELIRSKDPRTLGRIQRAARFIYLNKTAFNGLYRVNKSNKFNVPMGSYKNPKICDSSKLRQASRALHGVNISCCDFASILSNVKNTDAVYMDPPYIPISKTSSFTAYNGSGFSIDDHRRLCECFKRLVNNGTKVVLSNSSSPLTYELYDGYRIIEITGTRSIGGSVSSRNSVKELLITNK